jgi:hypothetical protein
MKIYFLTLLISLISFTNQISFSKENLSMEKREFVLNQSTRPEMTRSFDEKDQDEIVKKSSSSDKREKPESERKESSSRQIQDNTSDDSIPTDQSPEIVKKSSSSDKREKPESERKESSSRQIQDNTSDDSIPADQSQEMVKKSSAESELVENNKLKVLLQKKLTESLMKNDLQKESERTIDETGDGSIQSNKRSHLGVVRTGEIFLTRQ